MPEHTLNDAVRFLLEVAALVAMGYWGWTTGAGVIRWLLAIGLPLVAMALWGTFRVPDDPGPAPIAVPGPVRLALELVLFLVAVVLLSFAAGTLLAGGFGVLVVLHYVLASERVRWLLGVA